MRYKNDCKELYGRILGSQNVVSFTQASCKKQTEEIWSRMYPCEPYELNLSTQISEDSGNNVLGAQKSTNYDLVSAVKRQSSFYYQVMEKSLVSSYSSFKIDIITHMGSGHLPQILKPRWLVPISIKVCFKFPRKCLQR